MITELIYNNEIGRWVYECQEGWRELHAGDSIVAYVPESNSPFCNTYIWEKVRIEFSWHDKSWFLVSADGIPILEELYMLKIKS